MENLATAIPKVDNILQSCSGLSGLSRVLIITAALMNPIETYLPFYLEVSKSILSEVHYLALTHLRNGLANVLNKTAVLYHLGVTLSPRSICRFI